MTAESAPLGAQPDDARIGQEHRQHPNSLANLRPPWQPGESPNPGGRPRGASILAPFLREMAANPDEDGYGAKAVEAGKRLASATVAGDKDTVKAILDAMDRTDGPITKQLDVATSARVVIQGSKVEKPPELPPEVGEVPV